MKSKSISTQKDSTRLTGQNLEASSASSSFLCLFKLPLPLQASSAPSSFLCLFKLRLPLQASSASSSFLCLFKLPLPLQASSASSTRTKEEPAKGNINYNNK
jgi:hypothetical protein